MYNGTGGRPLAYVIRDEATPPAAANDPVFGAANCVYTTIRDEVTACAFIPGAGDAPTAA